MSSLDSHEKLIDLEGKGRGKGKDKRAKGHEGKRAKGQKGIRAKGQKPQTIISPLYGCGKYLL